MAIDSKEFRQALGRFATGVTVITTRNSAGEAAGLTANAFSSLSLDPPLVLFCLDKRTGSHPAFVSTECFAVNVLAGEQQPISDRFARRGEDKFSAGAWREGVTGVPILAGALAQLECRTWAQHDGGDHTIIIGEVLHLHVETGDPLLFFQGRYGRLATDLS